MRAYIYDTGYTTMYFDNPIYAFDLDRDPSEAVACVELPDYLELVKTVGGETIARNEYSVYHLSPNHGAWSLELVLGGDERAQRYIGLRTIS